MQHLPLNPAQRALLDHPRQVFQLYIAQSERANRDFRHDTRSSYDAANDLINNLAYIGVTHGLDQLALAFARRVDLR